MRMHANYGGLKARLSREELDVDAQSEDETVKAKDAVEEEEGEAAVAETPTEEVTDEGAAGVPEVTAEQTPAEEPAEGETPAEGEEPVVAEVPLEGEGDAAPAEGETPAETPVEGEPVVDAPVEGEAVTAEEPAEGATGEAPEGGELPLNGEDPIVDSLVEGEDGAVPEVAETELPVEGAEGEVVVPAEGGEEAPLNADAEPEVAPEGAPVEGDPVAEPVEGEGVVADGAPVEGAIPESAPVEADPLTEGAAGTEDAGEVEGADTTDPLVVSDDVEFGEGGVIDGDETEADEFTGELGENIDSVEASLVDVTEHVGEVEKMNAEIDEGSEIVDELEAAVESLRITADNGGLDVHGGVFMQKHLTYLYKKAGVPVAPRALGLESFADPVTRVGGTTFAMEDVKATAGKLWNQIIELIQKGIQFIHDLFQKFFDSAMRLKARAEGLMKRAKETKGELTSKTFKNEKLAHALHIEGKVPPLVAVTAELAKRSQAVSVDFVKEGIARARVAIKAMSGGSNTELHNFKPIGVGSKVDAAMVGLADPGDDMTLYRSDCLPGNRALVQVLPAGDTVGLSSFARMTVKLGQFNSRRTGPETDEIATLSQGDAAAVCQNVIAMANSVLSYKSKIGEVDRVKQEIIQAAKKVSAANNGQTESENSSDANVMRNLARGAANMVDQPAQSFMPYQLNTGVSLLNAVELSLKQYAAKAAAPAAPDMARGT